MTLVTIKSKEIDRIYDRVKHIDEYQGQRGYMFFCNAVYDSLLLFEFPWGIIRVTDFIPGDSVIAHGLFLNKGILRNIEDLKRCADYTLDLCKIHYIRVIVPAANKNLARLLDRSCFHKVLPLRNFVYNGIIHEDGTMYEYGGKR